MTPAQSAMPQGIEHETPWDKAGYSHTQPIKPEPPEPVKCIEGFRPWDKSRETEMEYGFDCGVLWGGCLGCLFGGVAGAALVMLKLLMGE
jgi:hypothetical protein